MAYPGNHEDSVEGSPTRRIPRIRPTVNMSWTKPPEETIVNDDPNDADSLGFTKCMAFPSADRLIKSVTSTFASMQLAHAKEFI